MRGKVGNGETEKGNGIKLVEKSNKYDLTIMNTTITPEKEEIRNLETRSIPDGGIKRQLDYIMINESCKNWIRNVKTKGQADISQIYQHKIITMEINIRLKIKTEEKGRKRINYDIEELRENPQKLKMAETEQQRIQLIKRITERETELQKQREGNERGKQIWNTLVKLLTENKNKNSR